MKLLKKVTATILIAALFNACQTTRYVGSNGDYRFGPAMEGERVINHVIGEVGESYFFFGLFPAIDERPMSDIVPLSADHGLVNINLVNKYSGTDILINIGLCIVTACLSSIVYTRRTTILTGDVVENLPAH